MKDNPHTEGGFITYSHHLSAFTTLTQIAADR